MTIEVDPAANFWEADGYSSWVLERLITDQIYDLDDIEVTEIEVEETE